MLDSMQDKHRFMVRALTHRYRRDRADDFLDEMRARIDTLRRPLADGDRSPRSSSRATSRSSPPRRGATSSSLRELQMRVAAIVVNAATAARIAAAIRRSAPTRLPRRDGTPLGVANVAVAHSSVDAATTSTRIASSARPRRRPRWRTRSIRRRSRVP